MAQNWINNGQQFSTISPSAIITTSLPKKVYNLQQNEFSKEFYLTELYDKFEFDFKVYEIETQFINHVINTYNNTNTNLGVLLNGMKGTGKTVCAKMIANTLNLPVIIIRKPYEGMVDFLATIESDVVIFFDEFEKIFTNNSSSSLLSLMDGVYNTPSRQIFLLTSNNTYFDDSLLSRPSRIRYRKEFGNLKISTIMNYLNDNLIDKSQINEIISYVDTLEYSTIDILKCIVEELNIHKCPIKDIADILNISKAKYQYRFVICYEQNIQTEYQFIQQYEKYQKMIDEGSAHGFSDFMDWDENRYSTNRPLNFLVRGDDLGGKQILEPLNGNGIITVKDYDGEVFFLKLISVDNNTVPSLYLGELQKSLVF